MVIKMNNGYYDQIAKGYDELHKEEQIRKVRIISNHLKIKGNTLEVGILDVGCGTGLSALTKNTVGLDPSFELLKIGKQNRRCKSFINGVGENLPFKDKAFPIVTCITALHNFNSWKKGIDEMKRVSKGIVVISLLKKAKEYKTITSYLIKKFRTTRQIDTDKDTIFFCKI